MPERQGSDRADQKNVESRPRTDRSPGSAYNNRENRHAQADSRGHTDQTRGRGGKQASASSDELSEFIDGVNFPAGKHDIIHHAGLRGAPTHLIALLERIEERQYKDPADFDHAIDAVT
jgi:hypothetical protein